MQPAVAAQLSMQAPKVDVYTIERSPPTRSVAHSTINLEEPLVYVTPLAAGQDGDAALLLDVLAARGCKRRSCG